MGTTRILGPDGPLAAHVPNYQVREGQLTMAREVEKALEMQEVLLIEAGTGTGKTWAYLVPALLSGQRVLISTATRNLQEQIFGGDIPFLQKRMGSTATVAVLKGRSNYLCLDRLETTLPPTADDPNLEAYLQIERWSGETVTGDRSELAGVEEEHPIWTQMTSTAESCSGGQCAHYEDCFVAKARRTAVEADILIVNHHLFFADLALKEVWDGGLIPHPDAIIFDEAHGLEDIACFFFGRSLSNWQLKELVRDVRVALDMERLTSPAGTTLLLGITHASTELFRLFRDFSEGSTRMGPESLPIHFNEKRNALENQLTGLLAHLERVTPLGSPLATLLERTLRIRESLVYSLDVLDLDCVHTVERRRKGTFFHDIPIRVASQLAESLYGHEQALVFTSATLTTGGKTLEESFAHFASRMGLGEDVLKAIVPSPFDYPNQAALFLPQGLPNPNAEAFVAEAVPICEELIELTGGGTFLLFTSYRMLSAFHRELAEVLPYPVFKQGDAPKDALIRAFRDCENGVLFGTSSFWEGVDVAGDALRSVIIDKLPFASPGDPLVQARMEDLEERGIPAFSKYQLPQAILALKQGFGRLIRRREDRGIVTVLDPRLQKTGYGKVFLRALPPCPRIRSMEALEEWVKTESTEDSPSGRDA